MLLSWLEEKQVQISQKKFNHQLNKILAKERGLRKCKIINEMGNRDDILEENESVGRLFEQFKEDELSDDVSISLKIAMFSFEDV